MQRNKATIVDMIDAIEHILAYVAGMSYEEFARNEEKQDAVLRRIIVLGEATKRLSADFRELYPQISWKEIAGMRDVVVHNYDQIKVEIVWDVVQTDLSILLGALRALFQDL